jgi:hypothetical protein
MEKQRLFDKNCLGCKWYSRVWADLHICEYLLKTDKKRPCPPGKDCTVKELRKRKR